MPATTPEPILYGIFPDEEILPDDFPVHWDYLYVCDEQVELSPVGGGATVLHLKRALNVQEVRRCNLAERGLL